jgi:hypothetical protein
MKRAILLWFAFANIASGHVGSPDSFFEGDAGPYHLFVTIRKPLAIPGIAQFELRSRTADIREIGIALARADRFDLNLLPVPDVAERSKTDPQHFFCPIWLMSDGPLVAVARLDGTQGKAELAIPFNSYPQRTLPLGKGLGAGLIALMLILSAGVVSLVSAFVREGDLEPDAVPTKDRIRWARQVAFFTAVGVAILVVAGSFWWNAEAVNYQGAVRFFDLPKLEATLENANRLVLRIHGQNPQWVTYARRIPLVADHGHLMHLFLIRVPALDRMWHLHPGRRGSGEFEADLPALNAGRYHLFGDVVDKYGYSWTAVGEIDLPANNAEKRLGEDDSGWSGPDISASPGTAASLCALSGGARMVWLPAPLRAGIAASFRFRVEGGDGRPVTDMEPYMGMAGHAEFVRSDMGVFAHVHPAGTAPMAALELLQNINLPIQSPTAMTAMHHPGTPMPQASLLPEVSFPYAFPSSGKYRIFVQIKRAGRVETAVFDAKVE